MPTPEFGRLGDNPTIEDLTDYIYKLQKELNYLLQSLDTININRLDAKVIVANTITANKMNVAQLSAISADLGSITAGTVTGATIQTATAGRRIKLSGSELESLNGATKDGFTLDGATGFLKWYDAAGVNTGGINKDTTQAYEQLYMYHNNYLLFNAGTQFDIYSPLVKLSHGSGRLELTKIRWYDTGAITATTPAGTDRDMIWGTSSQGTGPHIWKAGGWYAMNSVAVP